MSFVIICIHCIACHALPYLAVSSLLDSLLTLFLPCLPMSTFRPTPYSPISLVVRPFCPNPRIVYPVSNFENSRPKFEYPVFVTDTFICNISPKWLQLPLRLQQHQVSHRSPPRHHATTQVGDIMCPSRMSPSPTLIFHLHFPFLCPRS